MNDFEAHTFIKKYFHELFVKRNIDSLDLFLHQDYWDDDIGDSNVDHIIDSKNYLKELFIRIPTINVEAIKTIIDENVITSYLHWIYTQDNQKIVWQKGIANFILSGNKIIKRHTFIFYSNN